MSTAHGETHARQRRLLAGAFSAQRVAALQPRIEAVVLRALENLEARAEQAPDAVVDLKAEYAHPVASQVIGELLGARPEDQDAILAPAGYLPATPQEMRAAFLRHQQAVEVLVAAKRRNPGEDLISDLITAQAAAGPASDEELVSLVLLMLNTGTEPAKNLITNAAVALLTRPDQLELVRGGRVTWDDVVEETLRAATRTARRRRRRVRRTPGGQAAPGLRLRDAPMCQPGPGPHGGSHRRAGAVLALSRPAPRCAAAGPHVAGHVHHERPPFGAGQVECRRTAARSSLQIMEGRSRLVLAVNIAVGPVGRVSAAGPSGPGRPVRPRAGSAPLRSVASAADLDRRWPNPPVGHSRRAAAEPGRWPG
jgi:hypothetical protein